MKKNKFIAWLLILSVFFSMFSTGLMPSYAESTQNSELNLNTSVIDTVYKNAISQINYQASSTFSVKEQLNKNLAYILKTVVNPTLGTGSGEWSILSLARGNYPVTEGYYETYYNNVVKIVQDKKNLLDSNKWTEHSRLILGLTSIGKDVTNVGGYSQLEKLADYNMVIKQGINGPIYALIALDSNKYEIPIVNGVAKQTTRDMLIQYILDGEINKDTANAGGWALSGKNPDPDITGMAIQALAAYYDKNPTVKAAVDRGITWLSSTQKADGGYASLGTVNAESTAQVVVAATAIGIDPHTDPRFIKSGNSAVDALLTFVLPEGGFYHAKTAGGLVGRVNGIATDQGTYALVAYDRFANQKNRLYDMTDLRLPDTTAPVITTDLVEKTVNMASFTFKATATDDVDGAVTPIVRVRDQTVAGVAGVYTVTLAQGANTITVTATDAAGNKVEAAFVINYEASPTLSFKEQLNKNLAYILKTVVNPTLGTGSGEWSILSLARGNYPVTEGYYETYYNNVVKIVQDKKNLLDSNKWTEHSRLILGLTSIGKDVTNVGGYSQLEKLADYNMVIKQGINGPIYALIALDSNKYEIPIVNGVAKQTTREMLIQYILDGEINKDTANAGGWALSGKNPDPDITGMAIQALAAYYDKNPTVKAAVDRGINWLSNTQKADGGYASLGTVNAESTAQVVVAATAVGIDPQTDPRFIKGGNSAVDALLTFALPEGGFYHAKTAGGLAGRVNGIATDQGTYALVAYDRFVNKKNRLYDMTDLRLLDTTAPVITTDLADQTVSTASFTFKAKATDDVDGTLTPVVQLREQAVVAANGIYVVTLIPGDNLITITATDAAGNKAEKRYHITYTESTTPPLDVIQLPTGQQPIIDIPQNNMEYKIPITTEDRHKEVTIQIPSDSQSKVRVGLPFDSPLPEIKAVKGNISAVIPSEARVTNGDSSALELITSTEITDSMMNKVSEAIPQGIKLDGISSIFSMGGNGKVEFSDFVTLTFTGMKGKDAAYIQGGELKLIHKYSSDSEGKNSGDLEYAYDSGNDLVVKTKHFTEFMAYASSSTTEIPDSGGGPQPKGYVTLSVDKLTIKKGYVVEAKSVELQPGDTAWTVLKRELDSNKISYKFVWTGKYGSVYVESIAGDGEFDHGSGSGWMYNVNGQYPEYGASNYILKNNDSLQWRYTTNLGTDLGEDPTKWEGPGSQASDKTPVIDVPKDIQTDYISKITKELKNTDNITINIPDVKPKVILNLEDVKDAIPMITAKKADISVVFEKGTQLKSGDSKIELLTKLDSNDTQIQDLIKVSLNNTDKLENINQAFLMGNTNSSVLFSKPVTLIFKDGKGQLPGFIEENKFTPIEIYETEEQGIQATKDNEKKTYAFVKDNDLYVKSNHFTSFVSYTISKVALEQNIVPVETPVGNTDLQQYEDADFISPWAYKAIIEATHNKFIQGNNGKFNPKSNITRAEFTKILASVLGLHITTDKVIDFTDVSQDDWFYPYVNAAYKAGHVTGYENNTFKPNEKITREQMAVIIMRALGGKGAKLTAVIKDIDEVSAWAKPDIESIVALELMVGDNDQFKPKDVVTREMAVVVAMRLHNYNKATLLEEKNESKVEKVDNKEVKKQIEETAALMQTTITDPIISSVGGDWTVFGLARSDIKVPDEYYAKYYANVEETLKEKSGKLHHVKYTEYDRVILALASIGKNIDNIAGYNLREPLADFDTLIKQGINGPIFALIALDSNKYDIPVMTGVKTQTTRNLLIDFILKREINGGGWALGDSAKDSDPDITAMAIQSLTPYYQTDINVKAAVDRGVEWLSKAQKPDGGYASMDSNNAESIAQVVVALTGLGINPHTDSRFIKNGNSALDALLSFAAPSGGFYHVKSGGTDNGGAKPGEVDPMATDQSMYALVSYDRFIHGKNRLYDMTDVKK